MTVLGEYIGLMIQHAYLFLAKQETPQVNLSVFFLVTFKNLDMLLSSSFLYLRSDFLQLLPFQIEYFGICEEAIKLSKGGHIGKIR